MSGTLLRTKVNFFVSIGLICVFGLVMTSAISRVLDVEDTAQGLIAQKVFSSSKMKPKWILAFLPELSE